MKKVLAADNINMGRQFEVDLARVFAIVTMVFVHVYEELKLADTASPLFNLVMEFAGGPLSAPLFMTAMGMGLVYSKRQDASFLADRGVSLIAQGYRLNVWRGFLVYLAAYELIGMGDGLFLSVQHSVELDILQFAGMAFLVFALLKRLNRGYKVMLGTAVAMLVAALVVPPLGSDSMLLNGIVGYFFYQNPYTSFPLFSWFIFPVAGVGFAKILVRVTDKTRFYGRLLVASTLLFALYTTALNLLGYDVITIFYGDLYYHQDIISAPWLLLICGITLSLIYYLSLLLQRGVIERLVQYISSHVNDIYMAQWVLIMWSCVFVFDRIPMTVWSFAALSLSITVLSVVATYCKNRLKARRS